MPQLRPAGTFINSDSIQTQNEQKTDFSQHIMNSLKDQFTENTSLPELALPLPFLKDPNLNLLSEIDNTKSNNKSRRRKIKHVDESTIDNESVTKRVKDTFDNEKILVTSTESAIVMEDTLQDTITENILNEVLIVTEHPIINEGNEELVIGTTLPPTEYITTVIPEVEGKVASIHMKEEKSELKVETPINMNLNNKQANSLLGSKKPNTFPIRKRVKTVNNQNRKSVFNNKVNNHRSDGEIEKVNGAKRRHKNRRMRKKLMSVRPIVGNRLKRIKADLQSGNVTKNSLNILSTKLKASRRRTALRNPTIRTVKRRIIRRHHSPFHQRPSQRNDANKGGLSLFMLIDSLNKNSSKSVPTSTVEEPTTKFPVITSTKETPIASHSVITSTTETPIASHSVITSTTETLIASHSVITSTTETPIASHSVITSTTEKPMASHSVISSTTEKPMASHSVITSTTETPIPSHSVITSAPLRPTAIRNHIIKGKKLPALRGNNFRRRHRFSKPKATSVKNISNKIEIKNPPTTSDKGMSVFVFNDKILQALLAKKEGDSLGINEVINDTNAIVDVRVVSSHRTVSVSKKDSKNGETNILQNVSPDELKAYEKSASKVADPETSTNPVNLTLTINNLVSGLTKLKDETVEKVNEELHRKTEQFPSTIINESMLPVTTEGSSATITTTLMPLLEIIPLTETAPLKETKPHEEIIKEVTPIEETEVIKELAPTIENKTKTDDIIPTKDRISNEKATQIDGIVPIEEGTQFEEDQPLTTLMPYEEATTIKTVSVERGTPYKETTTIKTKTLEPTTPILEEEIPIEESTTIKALTPAEDIGAIKELTLIEEKASIAAVIPIEAVTTNYISQQNMTETEVIDVSPEETVSNSTLQSDLFIQLKQKSDNTSSTKKTTNPKSVALVIEDNLVKVGKVDTIDIDMMVAPEITPGLESTILEVKNNIEHKTENIASEEPHVPPKKTGRISSNVITTDETSGIINLDYLYDIEDTLAQEGLTFRDIEELFQTTVSPQLEQVEETIPTERSVDNNYNNAQDKLINENDALNEITEPIIINSENGPMKQIKESKITEKETISSDLIGLAKIVQNDKIKEPHLLDENENIIEDINEHVTTKAPEPISLLSPKTVQEIATTVRTPVIMNSRDDKFLGDIEDALAQEGLSISDIEKIFLTTKSPVLEQVEDTNNIAENIINNEDNANQLPKGKSLFVAPETNLLSTSTLTKNPAKSFELNDSNLKLNKIDSQKTVDSMNLKNMSKDDVSVYIFTGETDLKDKTIKPISEKMLETKDMIASTTINPLGDDNTNNDIPLTTEQPSLADIEQPTTQKYIHEATTNAPYIQKLLTTHVEKENIEQGSKSRTQIISEVMSKQILPVVTTSRAQLAITESKTAGIEEATTQENIKETINNVPDIKTVLRANVKKEKTKVEKEDETETISNAIAKQLLQLIAILGEQLAITESKTTDIEKETTPVNIQEAKTNVPELKKQLMTNIENENTKQGTKSRTQIISDIMSKQILPLITTSRAQVAITESKTADIEQITTQENIQETTTNVPQFKKLLTTNIENENTKQGTKSRSQIISDIMSKHILPVITTSRAEVAITESKTTDIEQTTTQENIQETTTNIPEFKKLLTANVEKENIEQITIPRAQIISDVMSKQILPEMTTSRAQLDITESKTTEMEPETTQEIIQESITIAPDFKKLLAANVEEEKTRRQEEKIRRKNKEETKSRSEIISNVIAKQLLSLITISGEQLTTTEPNIIDIEQTTTQEYIQEATTNIPEVLRLLTANLEKENIEQGTKSQTQIIIDAMTKHLLPLITISGEQLATTESKPSRLDTSQTATEIIPLDSSTNASEQKGKFEIDSNKEIFTPVTTISPTLTDTTKVSRKMFESSTKAYQKVMSTTEMPMEISETTAKTTFEEMETTQLPQSITDLSTEMPPETTVAVLGLEDEFTDMELDLIIEDIEHLILQVDKEIFDKPMLSTVATEVSSIPTTVAPVLTTYAEINEIKGSLIDESQLSKENEIIEISSKLHKTEKLAEIPLAEKNDSVSDVTLLLNDVQPVSSAVIIENKTSINEQLFIQHDEKENKISTDTLGKALVAETPKQKLNNMLFTKENPFGNGLQNNESRKQAMNGLIEKVANEFSHSHDVFINSQIRNSGPLVNRILEEIIKSIILEKLKDPSFDNIINMHIRSALNVGLDSTLQAIPAPAIAHHSEIHNLQEIKKLGRIDEGIPPSPKFANILQEIMVAKPAISLPQQQNIKKVEKFTDDPNVNLQHTTPTGTTEMEFIDLKDVPEHISNVPIKQEVITTTDAFIKNDKISVDTIMRQLKPVIMENVASISLTKEVPSNINLQAHSQDSGISDTKKITDQNRYELTSELPIEIETTTISSTTSIAEDLDVTKKIDHFPPATLSLPVTTESILTTLDDESQRGASTIKPTEIDTMIPTTEQVTSTKLHPNISRIFDTFERISEHRFFFKPKLPVEDNAEVDEILPVAIKINIKEIADKTSKVDNSSTFNNKEIHLTSNDKLQRVSTLKQIEADVIKPTEIPIPSVITLTTTPVNNLNVGKDLQKQSQTILKFDSGDLEETPPKTASSPPKKETVIPTTTSSAVSSTEQPQNKVTDAIKLITVGTTVTTSDVPKEIQNIITESTSKLSKAKDMKKFLPTVPKKTTIKVIENIHNIAPRTGVLEIIKRRKIIESLQRLRNTSDVPKDMKHVITGEISKLIKTKDESKILTTVPKKTTIKLIENIDNIAPRTGLFETLKRRKTVERLQRPRTTSAIPTGIQTVITEKTGNIFKAKDASKIVTTVPKKTNIKFIENIDNITPRTSLFETLRRRKLVESLQRPRTTPDVPRDTQNIFTEHTNKLFKAKDANKILSTVPKKTSIKLIESIDNIAPRTGLLKTINRGNTIESLQSPITQVKPERTITNLQTHQIIPPTPTANHNFFQSSSPFSFLPRRNPSFAVSYQVGRQAPPASHRFLSHHLNNARDQSSVVSISTPSRSRLLVRPAEAQHFANFGLGVPLNQRRNTFRG